MRKILLLFFFISFASYKINAENTGSDSGYKVPRFITLKSDKVNLRVGSSTNYPIKLTYNVKNLPVKVTDEYEGWRKIIDINGNEGWIHKSLTKGDRYAIIYKKKSQLFNYPNGLKIGEIGKNNIVKINRCLLQWCLIYFKNNKAWIKKNKLWGVYEDEIFNNPFYQSLLNRYWNIKLYFSNIKKS